jgi:hypothetical protein
MKRRILPLIFIIVALVACTEPVLPEPPPTPEIVTVAVDPALQPLREALQICSDAHPELLVAPQEISPVYQDWSAFDLFIRLGEPPELPAFIAPLGFEQVVIVVNNSNPVEVLNSEELVDIFSGNIEQWSEIGGPSWPVKVWVYPAEDLINPSFEHTVLSGRAITSHALLAPHPAAMLEAISEDPYAIGLLPYAWLAESVHVLAIDPDTQQNLRLPILALAESQPEGQTGRLLYCLQQGEGQAEVLRLYER